MELITMEELKKRKIWQCFALEGEGEHKSKPPLSPITGIKSNGRKGAATYEEAVNYLNNPFGLRADGVGLLLVDGITLVDLDDILSEDGSLAPDIAPEMEAFLESLPPDTYVEISPSGRGLHILGIDGDNEVAQISRVRPYGKDIGLQKATIRDGKENIAYATVTGWRWRDFQVSSLSDISEILRTLKSLYFEEEEAPLLEAEEEEEEYREYPEEIRRLLKSGKYSKRWRDNFSRLWRGEPASSGESDSSATGVDYSLCLYLSELVSREEREEAAGCSKVGRLFEESPNFAKKDNSHLKRWSGSKELTISKAWRRVMEKREEPSKREEKEDTKAKAASLLASSDFASGFAEFMHTCFEEPEEGLSTGITRLDKILDGGIYPGVYVLGGTPGAGKTTFLLHLAEDIIKHNEGRSVLFFGLETSKAEVYGKLLSGRLFLDYGARFTYRDIKSRLKERSAEEAELVKMEYNSIVRELGGRLFLFPPQIGGYSVELISDTIELFMERREKPPLVIVDYLQIIEAEGNNDKERIDSSISALSELSKSLSLPLLLTTALNRASYSGDKKAAPTRLRNSAMKESGGIEYTCDCSIFLERQVVREQKEEGGGRAILREDREDFWGAKFRGMEVNEMDSKRPEYQTLTRYLRLTVNKDRNGGQGAAPLRYAPKYNAFEEDRLEVRYNSAMDDYITEIDSALGGASRPFWSGILDKC